MIESTDRTIARHTESTGDSAPEAERHATGEAAAARPLRIALAHDWLCGYRGGEAVLERITALLASRHEIAGLYVMFDDRRPLSLAVDRIREGGVCTASRLSRLPGGSKLLRRWLLPLYPRAVAELSARLAEQHARQPIDLVISTSSAAIKGLEPPAGVPHLCYCHAPARWVWSRREDYAGGLRGLGLQLLGRRFRDWDARTAAHVTHFIANSSHTAAEVKRCYRREAEVIHPPVRTGFFTPAEEGTQGAITRPGSRGAARPVTTARARAAAGGSTRRPFWLVVSALEPYKRVDLAVAASRRAGVELVIAGDGSQRRRLEQASSADGRRVRFLGRVSDLELRDLYRSARLLVFPQVEDFGIVAAEALACGLPVVARRAGGALDIIEDGITGALFDEPTVDSLATAAMRAPDRRLCASACRESALRFSEERFDEEMQGALERTLDHSPRRVPVRN